MKLVKRPNLPIDREILKIDSSGDIYTIEVLIKQTEDLDKYPPEGIKAVFRILKNKTDGDELVLLIDNHRPIGFHEHDELPENHESRKKIDAETWQEAWLVFDVKRKEVIQ